MSKTWYSRYSRSEEDCYHETNTCDEVLKSDENEPSISEAQKREQTAESEILQSLKDE